MTRHGLALPPAAALVLRPTIKLMPDATDGDSITSFGNHDRPANTLIPRQRRRAADRQARSGDAPVSHGIGQKTKSP